MVQIMHGRKMGLSNAVTQRSVKSEKGKIADWYPADPVLHLQRFRPSQQARADAQNASVLSSESRILMTTWQKHLEM